VDLMDDPHAELAEDGMILGRIIITRVLRDDDIVDHVIAQSEDGYEMGLAEALGMMRLAEDTLIRCRMDDDEGEDDDQGAG
jgi:hypothetical protein